MKIGNTEKGLLLGILGIGLAVLCFTFVFKPKMDSISLLNAESAELQTRLTELQQKEANRDQYIADTKKNNEEFDSILENFPEDLNQEFTVMFLKGIKDNNDFKLEGLTMGEPEEFYTLGNGGGDASLDETGSTDATDTEEVTTAQTDATEASSETSDGTLTVEDGEDAVDNTYRCYKATCPLEYSGQYTDIKNVIDYIDSYKDRTTISSITISWDSQEDSYTGEFELNTYAVMSPERAERKDNIDQVKTGVGNIFNNDAYAASGDSSGDDANLNKYDDNSGAAIVNNYDFYAILNPSTSDVSAKVVGQNGAGKESSVISNSDNATSTIAYEIYEKDGKTYCKYTLDNSSEYEAEVTSAEDVKILIQSSSRKNDDDKVAVRVTIKNTSKLPVYVKVSGDDAADPRVDIASKSGSVKVYK